ncbi:hypothetical protein AWB70_03434 [Caballeronia cordobensis]|uniref:Uncharacterized protein n=1 Tax=Caballeronia cordobensis TaxID=1353886 RepID=A0A158HKP1_CABCO|nr:hypothetical protein [Caballeronia cordobensis]SAL44687.1 hypothetical protein AWB70_03434 [Caballeronia cordobensis]
MKTRPVNSKAMDSQFDEWTKAVARKPTRRKTLQLISGGLFGALLTSLGRRSWAASSTSAAAPSASPPIGIEDNTAAASVQKGLSICRNQEYALCAGVRCFVYNNVAYCRCNLQFGDSVSRRLSYAGGDVCTFNAEGSGNGYVVSTFSVPPASAGPSGDRALYFCPPTSNSGAYASCDGGICFASTRGQSFPGLGRLGQDQIVCSCPIATGTSGSAAKVGHQIFGPYPCQASFFENCTSAVATGANGTIIYEGAPTGSYEIGALVLNGRPARFNMCFP